MKKYQDFYFKRAKQENYPARSVYKLQEIQKQCSLLGPGQSVLDLGAAPGSWTQYAAEKVGPGGRVLAVDLNPPAISFPPAVTFIEDDAFSPGPELTAALADHAPFDVVISDMAPKTTGIKFADQANSHELCLRALEMARAFLKPGGRFVAKIFQGPDVKSFEGELRKSFAVVKAIKPKSSRPESKEMFYAGLGFRPAEAGL